MKINGNHSGLNPYNLKSQNTTKSSKTFESEVSKASNTVETKKLTGSEDMEYFKKEVYLEIAEIHKNPPSYQLSTSIHITEDAFKRMKEEPEFKKEIMDLVRRDAQPIANTMGIKFHVTTTITDRVEGYVAFSANVYPHDSQDSKDDKKADAKKRAEEAFYYKTSSSKTDFDELWLENKQERQLLQEIQMQKSNLNNRISTDTQSINRYL